MAEERVQKILAQAGYGSRRSCEQLILAKRVRINGTEAVLGSKADPAVDNIQVDGQRIPDGHRSMGVSPWIENNTIVLKPHPL